MSLPLVYARSVLDAREAAGRLEEWAAIEDAAGHPASAAYARTLAARYRAEASAEASAETTAPDAAPPASSPGRRLDAAR